MPRLWLAALGAAAVMACGGDDSGNGPNQFPDVAGVYAIEGEFDDVDPEVASFTGEVTIEQASLDVSLLSGTADITLTAATGNLVITDAELQNASVNLAGEVMFTVDGPDNVTWTFTAQRAGDVLEEGRHTLTQGSQSQSGDWSGSR